LSQVAFFEGKIEMNEQKNFKDRRNFLRLAASVAGRLGLGSMGGLVLASQAENQAAPPPPPDLPLHPFRLGVASGDPLHDRVVLWTRLAAEPLTGGGIPGVDVPVIWELFADEQLTEKVRQGWTWAVPEFAHSVHVDVDGLQPSQTYWYRFRVGEDILSPVGKTKTFPRPDDSPERFRIALACCQKYRDGFYTPYPHMAGMELDAVLFLGDYIYESGGQTEIPGRQPLDTELVNDLEGFRNRYSVYRLEETLQQAHAAHPWIIVWDDHEVSNDYGGFHFTDRRAKQGDPRAIRAAGYQAWWEHMPVRIPEFSDPAYMKIYRRFDFGDLARLCMLDTRQYRDPNPCAEKITRPCEELLAGGLSILGQPQREWLAESLRESGRYWNLVGQQVLLSPVLNELGMANTDQWDGYIDDRQAVLDLFAEPAVARPIVLSGDVHAAGFADLYADAKDRKSKTVAYEVLTTSISSGGDSGGGEAVMAQMLAKMSPRTHYVDAATRGFAVCDLDRRQCKITYYAVKTVEQPESPIGIAAQFVIDAESFGFERV
jgi:alkaline phosphatase D